MQPEPRQNNIVIEDVKVKIEEEYDSLSKQVQEKQDDSSAMGETTKKGEHGMKVEPVAKTESEPMALTEGDRAGPSNPMENDGRDLVTIGEIFDVWGTPSWTKFMEGLPTRGK
ncbi:hypothetical protein FRC09_014810 [Ceratobasidium sp. 395]|nr:hypothetical protein FRC09_014810 [Ceratobasidium sp. 395]